KTLDAGAGYDSYSWSNGATTQTISVGPGSYTVTVTKNGCSSTSSVVTVTYLNVSTPTITILGSSTICASGSVTLKASSGVAYQWSHGSTAQFVSINTAGGYWVRVIDGNGCEATSAAVNVTVNPLPTATISGGATVCKNGASPSVTFTGSGGNAPYSFTYQINGGASQTVTTTSGSSVSVAATATAGGSTTYSLVNVSDANCSNTASGSATVVVNDLPTATINGSTTVCQNASSPLLTFTGIGGSAPYTFVYQVNGGANQTVTTTSGSSATLSVPTANAGTFTYSVVSVQNSTCSNTVSGSATIVVNALPSATISGGGSICQNGSSPVVAFTGSGGVAPYTFTYRINGGNVQSVTTSSGNSVSLNVPTPVAGTFIYSLASVQDGSTTACSNSANGSVSVTVNALPNATISGSTSVCQNSPSPSITFTGSGGVAPYTFSYKINSGAVQTVSATGNTVTVNVPTSSAGSFTYSLVNVSDASCSNNASGSSTVVVKTLPTATIGGGATLCQNSPSPVITITGNGGSGNYTFSYTINGGAVQTATGSKASIPQSTASAGTFTYSLVSVSDGGCSSPVSASATITINAQPQSAVIAAPVQHLCNGDATPITISNYAAGNVYAWYKDGSFFKSSNADTIMVNQAGNYYVVPSAVNGCAAGANSDTIKITTGTIPTPVITGYFHVCREGKTKLSAGGGFDKWRWTDRDDGRVVSEDSIFSAYAGQYHVEVEKGGCTDSTNVVVKADDTEFPAGQLKIEPAHIAYGAQATLTADVTNAVSYQWDLGNGNTASGAANVVRENYYRSGDSLKVFVTAVSERNCASTFTGYLHVDAMKRDTIANKSFAGNLKDWNVFPIPFRDHLKVSMILNRDEKISLDLFTIDGRWVRRWNYTAVKGEHLFTLDNISGLTPGVVYVITSFYNNQIHYEKLFKY
ncbi:MAG: C-terminal target protein, partial [Chitinophagaceae bacterium]|nr:C-terminal target protein [Chitinophagaceae bacterium]